MTRLAHKHRLSLLAVLLLCLSWAVWLTGSHVHVAEHTALDACVVCHYNAAALPATATSAEIIRIVVAVSNVAAVALVLPLLTLRPPVRAPPVNILV
jgi:hypothetical protein